MRKTRYGVDYDELASSYDAGPYRAKDVDPDFLAALEGRDAAQVALLDVGCGTGNQLVANEKHEPRARFVGLDPFAAMLAKARGKSASIAWVRGEGQRLPFASESFDLVTNQYSFHHVEEKEAMLVEVARVLKRGAMFVMRNIHPDAARGAALYRFFPRVLDNDLAAFPSEARYRALFASLDRVTVEIEKKPFTRPLSAIREAYARKQDCSNLHVLADADWRAGLAAIEAEIAAHGADHELADEVALVRIAGVKR